MKVHFTMRYIHHGGRAHLPLGEGSWFGRGFMVWERVHGLGEGSWFGRGFMVWERVHGLGEGSWFGRGFMVWERVQGLPWGVHCAVVFLNLVRSTSVLWCTGHVYFLTAMSCDLFLLSCDLLLLSCAIPCDLSIMSYDLPRPDHNAYPCDAPDGSEDTDSDQRRWRSQLRLQHGGHYGDEGPL